LARDFERTPEVLRGLHFVAFAILMLQAFIKNYVKAILIYTLSLMLRIRAQDSLKTGSVTQMKKNTEI